MHLEEFMKRRAGLAVAFANEEVAVLVEASANANVDWIVAKFAEVVEEHTCEEVGCTELGALACLWVQESSEEARLC